MKSINISDIKQNFPKLAKLKWENSENFEFKILDKEYICDLEPFFDIIVKNLKMPELFVRNSYEENLDIIERGGFFLGAFFKGEIAGIIAIDVPYGEQSLPSFMNLKESTINKCVIFDTICVLPKYRGNSLQEKLMCISEYLCMQSGYNHAFMSASIYNLQSLINAFRQDFVIFAIEELYGSENKKPVQRYLLYSAIGKTLDDVEEQYCAQNSNIKQQKDIIALDFFGMKITNVTSDTNFYVSYSKAFYD